MQAPVYLCRVGSIQGHNITAMKLDRIIELPHRNEAERSRFGYNADR